MKTSRRLKCTHTKRRKKNANDNDESIFTKKKCLAELYLQIGDCVIVIFEGKKFPGEIKSLLNQDEIEVSVIHQAKTPGMFKRSISSDSFIYNQIEIIKKNNCS